MAKSTKNLKQSGKPVKKAVAVKAKVTGAKKVAKAVKAAPKAAKPAKKVVKPTKVVAKAKPAVAKVAPKVVTKAALAKALKVAPKPAKEVKEVKTVAVAPEAVKPTSKAKAVKLEKQLAALIPETPQQEVILTNADGQRYCKVSECDEPSTSDGYCRFHYLAHWKRIQLRKKILAGDKLDRYIEELTARYPDKYLEMIRKDLASEKDFLAAIQELEIDDSGDEGEFEDDARNYIDEVRGVTGGEGTGSSSDEEF